MNPTVPQGASGFEVQLGVDGPVLAVGEKQSVLQAVLDAGADVLYPAKRGRAAAARPRCSTAWWTTGMTCSVTPSVPIGRC